MYPAGVSTRGVEDTTKGALGERRKRFNGVEAQQEALRGHRDVAQRADRAEVSLRVSRGVQGIAQGCREDKAPQNAFLRLLKSRGLGGVELFVSDAALGLLESMAEFYPEALRQRCVVHSYRNVYSRVPRGKVRQATRMLKATHASQDPESARGKAEEVVVKLEDMRLGKAAGWVKSNAGQTLAYHKLPSEHCRRIRTNNPMESVMREIKRRTRVVGALPDGNGASMSSAARIRLSNKIEGRRFGFDVERTVLMSVPRGIAGTQQAESCGTAAFERVEDVSRDSRRTGASLPLDRNWETGIRHRRTAAGFGAS